MNKNIEMTDVTSKELAKKLISCKTEDEAIAAAKFYGLELTPEQADELLKAMPGELSDKSLEGIAGGSSSSCEMTDIIPVTGELSDKMLDNSISGITATTTYYR